ncbi:MAG: FAD-dependent oxidoreductase [Actinomycetota bacterium]|nr:FAD-dependent oxidoreductase [Actinomycetota bacterium]
MLPRSRQGRIREALAGAKTIPVWLDDPAAPEPREPLKSHRTFDLAVIGGGFHGLWTALVAKERQPGLRVCVLEAEVCGGAASGRNGGFAASTLTHGAGVAFDRYPSEAEKLERLGLENLKGLRADTERWGIDCQLESSGELEVATREHEISSLLEGADLERRLGREAVFLDSEAISGEIRSPTYLAGLWRKESAYMLNPARLAWGLARTAEAMGVEIFDYTQVTSLQSEGPDMLARSRYGSVRAQRVALCTNAFPPLVKRLSAYVVPVYDYALGTQPLTEEQMKDVGWASRQGVADASNLFHYYRLTADNRILWGGYDAIYHFGGKVGPGLEQRQATFDLLARHFYATFPQLREIGFDYSWGGAIDTCSRFFPFFGSTNRGAVTYATGFTGLGVASTRFAARVTNEMMFGGRTEISDLEMVRSRPIPFPPEPLRYGVIRATRASLAGADRRGRRNAWLRLLDRIGLGFDS